MKHKNFCVTHPRISRLHRNIDDFSIYCDQDWPDANTDIPGAIFGVELNNNILLESREDVRFLRLQVQFVAVKALEPPASPGTTNTWRDKTQSSEKIWGRNLTIPAFVRLDTLGAISHQTCRTEAAWEADSVVERRTDGLLSQGGAGGLALVVETIAVDETTGTVSSCSSNVIYADKLFTTKLYVNLRQMWRVLQSSKWTDLSLILHSLT